MADALSDRTIDIVKATIPALEKGGTAVTDRMYQILFTNPRSATCSTSRITEKRAPSRRR